MEVEVLVTLPEDLNTQLNGGSGGGAGRASDGPGLGLQASYSGKGFGNDGGDDFSNEGAGGGGGAGSAGTDGTLLTAVRWRMQNSLQLPEQQHTMQEEDKQADLMASWALMVLEAEIM